MEEAAFSGRLELSMKVHCVTYQKT